MNNITKLFLSLLITLGFISCNSNSSNETTSVAPKLMWIDATANIERFNHKDTIDYYLEKLKGLGFTDIVVDMRPISGHLLYESIYAPQLTEWNGKEVTYS